MCAISSLWIAKHVSSALLRRASSVSINTALVSMLALTPLLLFLSLWLATCAPLSLAALKGLELRLRVVEETPVATRLARLHDLLREASDSVSLCPFR